jgi:hypothetical protein
VRAGQQWRRRLCGGAAPGERGLEVRVWALGEPKSGERRGAGGSGLSTGAAPLAGFEPATGRVVIDALFGAGLSKPLTGEALAAVERVEAAGAGGGGRPAVGHIGRYGPAAGRAPSRPS